MGATVAVTGAGGYIGRHVVRSILERGDDVLAVVRQPDPELAAELGRDRIMQADVFDLDTSDWTRLTACDALMHLAWRDGFVLRSRAHGEDVSRHYEFLLRSADEGIGRIAVLGTMHEIGYWEGAIGEDTPSNPTTPYGIAKHALRRLLETSLEGSETSLAWLRCYYITGDDERSNSVFNKILLAEGRGDTTFPFTSGRNLYDFSDVADLADQLVTAALDRQALGVIDCCSGTPQSLADAVEGFIAARGLSIRLEYGAFPDRPFDSPGVWGDPTRISAIMAHNPTRSKKEQ
ncbi:NAD(P)-dependent oxidoreductase [Microbacterium sp. CFH 90308]|uniref:NAD(P)-dependent oxidoreductase n=1 Tax=Microbacterium salsuginis TaxID=2722803 RepID=A0ABX1KC59_9MICO|nr:NAD(P)-dependent oxidoreductase [Microbacterium sp. CFH 90308]NLP83913.1 NAD(P)-dependent oxidoreductase [Microbacterium sp. CFH 90308]